MEYEEGNKCPEKCGGDLHYPKAENCSCHINPPCFSCTDVVLKCAFCGWEQEKKPIENKSEYKTTSVPYWERPKPSHDLGNGKRIFDYDYDSSSGSTMEFKGRYEGDVTAQDIINFLGDGTFGHRGPYLYQGNFSYTKITD